MLQHWDYFLYFLLISESVTSWKFLSFLELVSSLANFWEYIISVALFRLVSAEISLATPLAWVADMVLFSVINYFKSFVLYRATFSAQNIRSFWIVSCPWRSGNIFASSITRWFPNAFVDSRSASFISLSSPCFFYLMWNSYAFLSLQCLTFKLFNTSTTLAVLFLNIDFRY